ncbi:MAG: IS3 family transposase [Paraglaciecola polaris]
MEASNNKSARRSQRDYTLGFKLSVVALVEKGEFTYKQAQKHVGIQGRSTVLVWLRKLGKLDWSKPFRHPLMPKSKETPAQKIKCLEREFQDEKLINQVLNGMVDIMDKEYGAGLKKKVLIRYVWKAKQKNEISLAPACRLFGLFRQSVYQSISRMEVKRETLSPIKEWVMYWRQYMPQVGTRKLYQLIKPKLVEHDIKLGRDGLFTYLRREGLLVKTKKSYIKTTFSKHWMKKHPNLLKDKTPTKPEEVFVSDITYVQSNEGVHYLSLVTDAFSRKIVGCHLSNEMKATDVVKVLNMAITNRHYEHDAIHHSDRGLQYCSALYQSVLETNKIRSSMTDGYDCYQNALAERINGILKQEFLLYQCNTLDELQILVRESISTYNEMRPHLSLDMKTPNEVHIIKSQQKMLA